MGRVWIRQNKRNRMCTARAPNARAEKKANNIPEQSMNNIKAGKTTKRRNVPANKAGGKLNHSSEQLDTTYQTSLAMGRDVSKPPIECHINDGAQVEADHDFSQ